MVGNGNHLTNSVVRLFTLCLRKPSATLAFIKPSLNLQIRRYSQYLVGLQDRKALPASVNFHRSFSSLKMASAEVSSASSEITSTTDGATDNTEKTPEGDTNKRPIEEKDDNEAEAKKPKLDGKSDNQHEGRPYKKKKVAMLMVYSGKGYQGMQKNPGARSIEDDLLVSLAKAGVVTEDHISAPGVKMSFQRAARTDKGVSAAGQVCSLKIFVDVDNPVEKINSHLPDQIRVLGFIQTTKGFDSKNATSARTYMYILPTFAFCPFDQTVNAEYRAPSDINTRVNEVLSMFKGTHNFHNFTSGKKATDPSARRYITDFFCEEPYMQDDLELMVIKVKGQSFMLHQIRKMIGLTIAIIKGLTDTELIDKSWGPKKYDIPKAPGLGLMLDKVHYDAYNKRYGSDGIHEAIAWEKYEAEIEGFKKKFIYSTITETEKSEHSMLNWLSTLHLHHFDEIPEDGTVYERTPLGQAHNKIYEAQNPEKFQDKEESQPNVTASEDSKETKDEKDEAAGGDKAVNNAEETKS